MKNALFQIFMIPLIFLFSDLKSQVEYLRLSPSQKIVQRIGATDVTLEYSRPQMKGRKIFGKLVPYGQLWRTGANENTKISFNHKVKIGKIEIKAGIYSLITRPRKSEWDIYFYTETNNLDVPIPIDSSKLIYLTTVDVKKKSEPEKTLVINFYDITETSVNLGICWETISIKIPIHFYTREAQEKNMRKEFEQNILDYSIAASFYYQRDIELKKAKRLQQLIIDLRTEPRGWDYLMYGKILYKLGKIDDALVAVRHSIELSIKSQKIELIKEGEALLKDWQN